MSSTTNPAPDAEKDSWRIEATGYKKHAQRFTGKFATSAVQELVGARLKSKVPFPKDEIRCLDIAAGTGAATLATVDAIRMHDGFKDRPIRLTATDLSAGMLEQLDAQLPERVDAKYKDVEVKTLVQDMTDLKDIPDGSIDICTMVYGIMFPDDPIKALKEVKRVLDPNGGVATIVSHSWNTFIQLFQEATFDQGKIDNMADYDLPYTDMGHEHHLRIAAGTAGFTKMRVSYVQHHGVEIPTAFLAHSMNNNPGLAKIPRLDQAKFEAFLMKRSAGTNKDGPFVLCGGTALCLQLGLENE